AGLGGIAATGFSGLMTDGAADYRRLFDPDLMAVSTASGTLSIDEVAPGTAEGPAHDQHFGFQLGVFVPNGSPAFRLAGRVLAPFSGLTPQPGQEMGIMLGPGDQDDFAEVVVGAGNGSGEGRLRLQGGEQRVGRGAVPARGGRPGAADAGAAAVAPGTRCGRPVVPRRSDPLHDPGP